MYGTHSALATASLRLFLIAAAYPRPLTFVSPGLPSHDTPPPRKNTNPQLVVDNEAFPAPLAPPPPPALMEALQLAPDTAEYDGVV